MAIWTNTPAGLPMAMTYNASCWSYGATNEYAKNVMMTIRLLATGAMEDHK